MKIKNCLLNILVLMIAIVSGAGVSRSEDPGQEKVIQVTVKKFEYNPSRIALKKGVPVILEFKSLDRKHGFNIPDLGIKEVIKPGEVTRVKITPQKTGHFPFHCSVFCGSGHEGMTGEIVVTD